MKKISSFLVFTIGFALLFSCSSTKTASSEEPVVQGTITEVEKYGHVVLDISIEEFARLGYELGDTVDVLFSSGYIVEDIPYFNGYYVDAGEPMIRAYPGDEFIAVCINYGKMNETAGGEVGDGVEIWLHSKASRLADQELNSLVYTNERSDYESDAVFANFRMVASGLKRLYRSASPADDSRNRSIYANALIKEAGVNAVLNLADNPEEVEQRIKAEGFSSDYYGKLYEEGKVIALGMPVDYSSGDFAKTLTAGFKKLSYLDPPYLIHCPEGKDRAGFASALVSCLMGASCEEVVEDYMLSYANYYKVDKESDPEKYEIIVKNNIDGMLEAIAQDDDIKSADLEACAENYLLNSGMSRKELDAFKAKLPE